MSKELERLKSIIIQLLLRSESRTTDFLELVVNDRLNPVVTEQRMIEKSSNDGRDVILRESLLVTETFQSIISQNITFIYPDSIPLELYSKLLYKKEGIGKVIKSLNIESTRRIKTAGWRINGETTNLFGECIHLAFGEEAPVPYKEYTIEFEGYTSIGIYLLEYFNPSMFSAERNSQYMGMSKEGVTTK